MKQGIYQDDHHGSTGLTLVDHNGDPIVWLNDTGGHDIHLHDGEGSGWNEGSHVTTEEPIVTQEELVFFIREMQRRKGL